MKSDECIQQGEVLVYCKNSIKHFEGKANHNKKESLRCFSLVTVSTLAIPLFISFGEHNNILGRIIPSVLSFLAAGATAWLQLRKPQLLWSLYRSAQRELEYNQTRFIYKLGDFENSQVPDKLLAEKISEIILKVHNQWAAAVPNPSDIKGIESGPKANSITTHT